MTKKMIAGCILCGLVLGSTPPAAARQGGADPGATPSAGSGADRPPPGPAVRERAGRRRRGSSAQGVLFLVILVGAMGYYVVKKLRR